MDLEDDNLENSDTEDEDFVPEKEQQEVSEEEEEEEIDDDKTGKPQRKGRKKKSTGPKAKRRRKGRGDDSDEDSDDEADADFVLDQKFANDEVEDVPEDPEVIAAKEKKEKERTDVLWSDFLTSVETMKSKKTEERRSTDPSRSKDKTVTKVYDFAGERVEIQERVRVTPEDSETRSSTSSSLSSLAGESSNSLEGSSRRLNGSGSLFLNGIEAIPNKPPPPKRIRISFLSGDPAEIGLGGDKKSTSAKEGLANVLSALHARNKKLGTLDKSKLDWEAYKRDEGLQEELESHTRSKDTYIDKQEFLQRADLRQFEQEKAARAKRRRNNL